MNESKSNFIENVEQLGALQWDVTSQYVHCDCYYVTELNEYYIVVYVAGEYPKIYERRPNQ